MTFSWSVNGQAIIRQVTDGAAGLVADEVLAETVRDCPVDTSTLANSYTVDKPREGERLVGTTVEYAPFVEFGTRFAWAQPHLGPALERARQRYG